MEAMGILIIDCLLLVTMLFVDVVLRKVSLLVGVG